MKLFAKKLRPETVVCDVVVYPMTEEQASRFKGGKGYLTSVKKAIRDKDFKGEHGDLFVLKPDIKAGRLMLLGLGKEKEVDAEKIRKAYSLATCVTNKKKLRTLATTIPTVKLSEAEAIAAAAEGIILTDYSFDKYKTDKKEIKTHIHTVTVLGSDYLTRILKEIGIVCDTVNFVRDMVNEPADIMNPAGMLTLAKKMARENKLKITVMGKKELARRGMNCILAVAQGSIYPPHLIILEYTGNKKSNKKYALVGKGVTFDTGGINLKPTGYIETMKEDMAGAATVIGTLHALAQLKTKVNVVGVIPVAENMIGSRAARPSDIVKSYSGKTVEIGNTDAEGRLILADALAYANKDVKPTAIIEFSTLTGAILITFGTYVAGMFTTNEKLAKKIFAAGEKTYDRVWQLPLYEEYIKAMKGTISDLHNIGTDKWAGSITAAGFLKNFVGKTPWVHIDIGGTAFFQKEQDYRPKGGTGFGVRLLVEFFKRL